MDLLSSIAPVISDIAETGLKIAGTAAILADPNTEETNTAPDRLEQTVKENVILNAQAATTETINDELSGTTSTGTGDLSGNQRTMLEKPYHIKDFSWSRDAENTVSHVLSFPHGLFPAGLDTEFALASWFRYLAFYKFAVKFTLNVNPMMFNSGIGIIAYSPRPLSLDWNKSVHGVRALPHATLQAKSTSEATFTVPYNNPTRMYHDDQSPIGDLFQVVWAPLQDVTGSQDDLQIALWFNLEDVQIAAMGKARTPFTTASYAEMHYQLQRSVEKCLKGSPADFFRNFLTSISGTSLDLRCQQYFPEYLHRAMAVIEEEAHSQSEGVKNFSLVTMNTVGKNQSKIPVHDLSFAEQSLPPMDDFSSHQPFDLKSYCQIPGKVASFSQSTQDAVGDRLFEMPVCPSFCDTVVSSSGSDTVHLFHEVPCSSVSRHYLYWRGQMKFNLEDAGSMMHRSRIKMVFIPNVTTAPTNPDEVRSAQTVTVDIGLQETTSMIIDFQSPTDWKKVWKGTLGDVSSEGSFDLTNSIGVLAFYVMTPLNKPETATDNIRFIVNQSFFGDFAVPHFYDGAITPVAPYTLAAFETPGYNVWPLTLSTLGEEPAFSQSSTQGSFTAASGTNLPAQTFATSSPLPSTYISDHTDLEWLMTRPANFPVVSPSTTFEIAPVGSHLHLNRMSGYWRGRPVLSCFTKLDSGLWAVGSQPVGVEMFRTSNFLANGCYLWNQSIEPNVAFCLPFYHPENVVRTGLPVAESAFLPVDSDAITPPTTFLSWVQYTQSFPLPPPCTQYRFKKTTSTPSGTPSGDNRTLRDNARSGSPSAMFEMNCGENLCPEKDEFVENSYIPFPRSFVNRVSRVFRSGDRPLCPEKDEQGVDEVDCLQNSMYVCDLTTEGIEPNPGPVDVCEEFMNARVLGGPRRRLTRLEYLAMEVDMGRVEVTPQIFRNFLYAPFPSCLYEEDALDLTLSHTQIGVRAQAAIVSIVVSIETYYHDQYPNISFPTSVPMSEIMSLGPPPPSLSLTEQYREYENLEVRARFRPSVLPDVCTGSFLSVVPPETEMSFPPVYVSSVVEKPLEYSGDMTANSRYMANMLQSAGLVGVVAECKREKTPTGCPMWLSVANYYSSEFAFVVRCCESWFMTKVVPSEVYRKAGVAWQELPGGVRSDLNGWKWNPENQSVEKRVTRGLIELLLIISGDVEQNPGPTWDWSSFLELKDLFERFSHKRLHNSYNPTVCAHTIFQGSQWKEYRLSWSYSPGMWIATLIAGQGEFQFACSYAAGSKSEAKSFVCAQFCMSYSAHLSSLETKSQAGGIMDRVISAISDRVMNQAPVLKILEAVSTISDMADRAEDYCQEGVNQIKSLLCIIVQILLLVINLYLNPSIVNMSLLSASFVLSLYASPFLSSLCKSMMDSLSGVFTSFIDAVALYFRPEPKVVRPGACGFIRRGERAARYVVDDEEVQLLQRPKGKINPAGVSEPGVPSYLPSPYKAPVSQQDFLPSESENESEDEVEVEEPATSASNGDVMAPLVSGLLIVLTAATGCSAGLSKDGIGSVTGKVMQSMKNFSTVGRGLGGISSIIQNVGSALHGVVGFIQGGVSQDERANIYFRENKEAIAQWLCEVDEFEKVYKPMEVKLCPVKRAVVRDLFVRGKAINEGCLFCRDANAAFTKLTLSFKAVSDWNKNALKGASGSSVRAEPVVVFLTGEPGQGKSLLSTLLATDLAQFFGTDRDRGVYSMNCHSDFMDGYAQQPVVIYDDLGQDAKGEDWKTFTQMVSTTQYYPNMASLEEKGEMFLSPVIIASSNTAVPRPASISTATAIHRRLKFPVVVTAKDAKKLPNGKLNAPLCARDGSLADGSCFSLMLKEDVGDQRPTPISCKDLMLAVRAEIVSRAKVANTMIAVAPAVGPTFDEAMAQCGKCVDEFTPHAKMCACNYCEALALDYISGEDFVESTRNDKKASLRERTQDWYVPVNVDIYSKLSVEEISLKLEPLYFFVEAIARDEDSFKMAVNTEKIPEWFLFRRLTVAALKARTRETWVAKFTTCIKDKVSENWKFVAKVCAGLALLVAMCKIFAIFSYASMSRTKQRILTHRMPGGHEFHNNQHWWANHLSERLRPRDGPVPEDQEERKLLPERLSSDPLLFPEGEDLDDDDVAGHLLLGLDRTKSEGAYTGNRVGGKRAVKSVTVSNGGAVPRDQVVNKLLQNVYSVYIVYKDPTCNQHAVGVLLDSVTLMLPHHAFLDGQDIVEFHLAVGASGSKTFPFEPERCHAFNDKSGKLIDLVLYRFPKPVESVRKISTKCFVKESSLDSATHHGISLLSVVGQTPKRVSLEAVSLITEKKYDKEAWCLAKCFKYHHNGVSVGAGDSGSLIVSAGGATRDQIIGIHVAGDSKNGYALPLPSELIHQMRTVLAKAYSDQHIEAAKSESLRHVGNPPEGFVCEGSNAYLGKVTKYPVSIMRTTQFEKSVIHGVVDVIREPAPLRSNDSRVAEGFVGDPMHNAPKKFANAVGYPNEEHLAEVVDHTVLQMSKLINLSDPPRVFDENEMVNGLGVDEAFQQVEMSSSAGWPFAQVKSGGKKGWFNLVDSSPAGNVYTLGDVLKQRIDDREFLARQRVRIQDSAFTTFLKDELRPVAKCAKNGTRTVECGPLDHLLLSRKYFGHFLNTVQKHPVEAFGCCVGIDPEIDLSFIENYLREFSDSGVAEDFTLWDGSIKPRLIFAAGEVINKYYGLLLESQIAKEPTHEEQLRKAYRLECNVRDTLISEIAFTRHVSGDVMTLARTGLPSGHFFTSILNSLLHRLINGLAWMKGTSQEIEYNSMSAFTSNVRDVHYGDDGKDAIKKRVQHLYNRLVKQEVAKELGMIYTMEDKESEMVAISPLSDCGFLKRHSVKHAQYGLIWNVPMEKRTIHSLINWKRKAAKFEDNLKEAFREAYHWGAVYYNELKTKVIAALVGKNIEWTPPTWKWQDRAFLARFGMINNPYLKKQFIGSNKLVFARMMNGKEEDVLSTNPLSWQCKNPSHEHQCGACGREVFGLLKRDHVLKCMTCFGYEEPTGYAHC